MTIHPVHSTIFLPPLHLLDNQSINTSICAPIQQFISPSFIHLSIIYPSIHPHTLACFHQFPAAPSRLHFSCFKWLTRTTGHMFDFQTENRMAFQSIDRVSRNHSGDSMVQGKCKIQQERKKQLKTHDRKPCTDTVQRRG